GARNALLWARRLRKTAWIVPHPPWCTRSGASIPELRLGGLPLARARDVMQWLSQRQLHAVPPQAVNPSSVNPIAAARIAGSPASRQGAEQADVERLVAHLRASAGTRATEHPPEAGVDAAELHPDILCRELAWDAARLNAAVLYATLQGEVERRPSGNIACTRCRHG